MAAPVVWDEQQAYEELLYWDRLLQEGHRLLPHDFDRYTRGVTLACTAWERWSNQQQWLKAVGSLIRTKSASTWRPSWGLTHRVTRAHQLSFLKMHILTLTIPFRELFWRSVSCSRTLPTFRGQRPGIKPMSSSLPTDMAEHYMLHFCIHALILFIMVFWIKPNIGD